MKNIYIILLFILGALPVWSQVAVNSPDAPNANLLVRPSSYTAPDSKSGVLIPRVQSLVISPDIPDGMLVYLDNPTPPLPGGEINTFYYWDKPQNKWIPFITRYSELLSPPSVFYASGTTFINAPTDRIAKPDVAGVTAKPKDNINITDLTTNNDELCEVMSDGNLKIKKTGWYYIQLSATLTKSVTPVGLRDILAIQLLKNGELVTLDTEGNILFRGISSFPGRNANASSAATQMQTMASQAPVRLEEDDILSLSCEIIYEDPRGETNNNTTANRSRAQYIITGNPEASITGRYMGDF